ncbi:MAG: histidine kinase [Alphaproteobacteria bacterium]
MIASMISRQRWSQVCAVAALVLLLGGCSGSSVGDVDSVFLTAAGSWDRNRDNVVTCEEWKAYAGELFDEADANRDGIVDTAEYGKIVSTDRMFQTVGLGHYDANGDGKLTRAEFVDKPNRAFVLLDKNKECRLTGNQVAGARARTEKIFEHKKPESGDPRDAQKGPGGPI